MNVLCRFVPPLTWKMTVLTICFIASSVSSVHGGYLSGSSSVACMGVENSWTLRQIIHHCTVNNNNNCL